MFSRVPKLPVDVVFKSVLHDPIVTDFSSYSETLLSYLSEAAKIAQQHTVKEQEHQACQYNKKVKGVSLYVGARVLLANKGERGKKKLADKWEPAVYTVVDMNPKTQIYKISDVSGQCKVVHRNLLLDISSLPVRDTLVSQSLDGTSDIGASSVSVESDGLNSLEKESSQACTSMWVLSESDGALPGCTLGEEFASQLTDEAHTGRDEIDG